MSLINIEIPIWRSTWDNRECMGQLDFYNRRKCLIYGAPGEIRTPDLVVRSHAFENAFHTMIYDTIVQRLSQIILSFKEFPAYNGGIPYLIWDDKGVTTVGFSL